MSRYYDKQGQPITLDQWSELRESSDYYRIAETHVRQWWISTVWLGLDHAITWPGTEHIPLIFETMVFDQSSGNPYRDLEMQRYTTEEQALCGHYRMVAAVQGWDRPSLNKEG